MHHMQRKPLSHRVWVVLTTLLLLSATAADWSTPRPATAPALAPPAAITPTPPPQEINLRQLGLQLYSHASFAFELEKQDPAMRLRFGGRWTGNPFSWYIENMLARALELAFTIIGDRQWVTLASGEALSCDGWKKTAQEGQVYQACDLGTQSLQILQTASKSFFADVPARYSGEQVIVDGVPCHVYTVRDVSNDGEGRWYVAIETGLPVRFEVATLVWRFFNFDDPGNVIPPPVSGMPAELHMDEARMAFNGVSSFRYDSQMMFQTSTVSTYTVAGVYVLAGPTWQARVSACPTCQPVEVLSSGGRVWQRPAATSPWVPVAKDSQDALLAEMGDPFYSWPGQSAPRIAKRESGQTLTVASRECQVYRLSWTRPTSDGGQGTADVRMCVSADRTLPLVTEYLATSSTTGMDVVCALSHLDDPANVVSPLPTQ